MALDVAIQMDPMEPMDINADSLFAMALEAQRRGHKLYHYQPKHLSFRDGAVTAHAAPLTVQRKLSDHYSLGARDTLDLTGVDVVLMRQDPPFDMSYITATHILDHIHPKTLVVNDPSEVRNAPEKLFITHFDNIMPPTLISSDAAQIQAFRDEHKDIIVKPLFGNGGHGVFHVKPGDENLNALLEVFSGMFRDPLIVQRYLPEVRRGDKRVILIDGKPVGAINRVPADGEARSNMHVGGKAVKCEMTARDLELAKSSARSSKKRGMIFVGIDVIGDYMTEINVTSPTGIQELSRFDDIDVAAMLWDAIESKL